MLWLLGGLVAIVVLAVQMAVAVGEMGVAALVVVALAVQRLAHRGTRKCRPQ